MIRLQFYLHYFPFYIIISLVIFMKLFKNIKFKPLCISLGMVAIQTIFYYMAKVFQGEPNIIGGIIDTKIPFCNIFIIPYCIWYVLIFTVPYYLYIKDKDALSKYIASYAICSICADIIFVIYPTTIVRPVLHNNGFFNYATIFIYSNDMPPVNCMPSLHCAVSMLFIFTTFSSKEVSNTFKIIIFIVSILIMMATLFIKQHVFIDFLTGITLMTYTYIFVINNKKLLNKVKKLLQL